MASNRETVRVFRLGDEPRDDLSDTTTAEERLRILRDLSERAWRLSGRPFPGYSRSEIPVRVIRADRATGRFRDLAEVEALGEDPSC